MFLPSFNSYHLSTHPTLCPALFSLLVLPKQRQKPTTNNKTKTNPKLQKLKTIKRPKRKKNAEAKQNKKYTKKTTKSKQKATEFVLYWPSIPGYGTYPQV